MADTDRPTTGTPPRLTRAQWQRVTEAFLSLADASGQERADALAHWRRTEADVADVLARMLAADEQPHGPLDGSVATHAASLLAPEPAVPDTRFGPYRLVRLIGEGGMGVVYLAHRDDLDAHVAIKVLRDAWLSPSRRERFREEQRTLVSLEHPGIARLLDADHLDDGTPWFAMEYVEGVPITAWCRSQALDVRDRLALVIAALDAVRHAHERAIIHRDLKPSNLFVTPAGRVKLLDFGIARRTGSAAVAESTRTGLRLLTPAYAAPEQLAGEPVGVQADVYAIGVLLFELLTGARPFDLSELSTAEAVRKLREGAPPRVSLAVRRAVGDARVRAVAPDALTGAEWADLDALVAGALDADLARRYRSADALLRDLQRFLASEPLEMRPATLGYRARLFVRRRRAEVLLAGVAGLVLVLGATAYTRGITEARDAAQAQAARTERLQAFLVQLFSGGDAEAGPADTLRVATLLDNGVREARRLDDDPEVQLDMLQSLGTIAQQLGRYALADSLFSDAVRGRERQHGAEHEETLHARALAAGLLIYRQDHDAARDAFRLLLETSRRLLPADHRLIRRATEGLGAALTELGDYDEALPLLEASVRSHARDDSTALAYGDALTSLANLHSYAGRRVVADSLNVRALEIARRALGDDHPSLAYNHVNLALSAAEQGRYDDAEPHYLRALALNERWHGAEHPRTAPIVRMLAQLRVTQGRVEEAIPLLERAVRIFEASVDSLSPSLANTYSSMAQLEAQRGDHEAAIRLHSRAREIARRALGTSHLHFRMHTGNLAAELTSLQRYGDAERMLVPMLADARATLPADDVNLAFWTIRLGRVRAGQQRWSAADSLYALGLEGMRRSGFADTATIGRLTREREQLQANLPTRR